MVGFRRFATSREFLADRLTRCNPHGDSVLRPADAGLNDQRTPLHPRSPCLGSSRLSVRQSGGLLGLECCFPTAHSSRVCPA